MPSPVAAKETPKLYSQVKSARFAVRFFFRCAPFFFAPARVYNSAMFQTDELKRLQTDANLWLATVRPNQTPHLVPIWFVWHHNKAYICTARESVKARNIASNPRVSFALENGSDPVVVEGEARILDKIPDAVSALFASKYNWNISQDSTYDALIEINPHRVLL